LKELPLEGISYFPLPAIPWLQRGLGQHHEYRPKNIL
jgi:hypothetical protein